MSVSKNFITNGFRHVSYQCFHEPNVLLAVKIYDSDVSISNESLNY